MKISIIFLSFILLFFSCTRDNPVINPPGRFPLSDTIIKDVSYGNNVANKLDLGLPGTRNADSKLVIVIHGGGWSSGDKSELNFITEGLKKRGFVVANINYRLSPQSSDNYKMQLDDIDTVISFLNQNAAYYTFGTKNIYIAGHSAGAHLSLSYSYTRNGDGKIKAVAGMASPTNLFSAAYYNTVIDAPLLMPYLGAALDGSSEQRYKDCSPFYHVSGTTIPSILFQGDLDFIIQKEQSVSLAATLTQNGVENKLIIYPLTFHDWWANADLVNNTLEETAAWFNGH